ncbi:hypothetical protein AA0119_g4726 [Alternaria tenuissima]|jgi:hypothetical protein|uniref:Uncharacterized protein n=2 Tax=Alternaria alternata complex TaxID=187734 RepID=A0A4V1WT15_ALTAL|nr:uncharacterized protein J4E82_000511 [Alternaria postmessia]RYN30889.1 hypothetical protein AA0115_g4487 [Alternaria tenuissima]RYN82128.1 hypothetical protein AA0117_g1937 [Alternaria alternata]KAI5380554.1 hypothetical protein J4E82_000511 [Alternaria postmessia]RYN52169.1 hypothetical protein AA0114_g5053 [Alternaria tenuissima]RYN87784.1 hypothetical protein AA0120_g7443 [Alternaria tenuissima]
MGSSSLNPSSPRDDETVLFLFIAFAILIVLLLLLVLISCQTWMLWKMAKAVVEQDTQITQRGRKGYGYDSSGGSKRRSVRGSIYTDGEEERKLMSGGSGNGPGGKRRTGVWGVGGWV